MQAGNPCCMNSILINISLFCLSTADDFHDHLPALAGGLGSELDREVKEDFMDLQIVKYYENEVRRHTFASQWKKIMAP